MSAQIESMCGKKSRYLKISGWILYTSNINVRNQTDTEKKEVALNKVCPYFCSTDPDWFPKCETNVFLDDMFTYVELNLALDYKNK